MAAGIQILHVEDDAGFAELTRTYLTKIDDRFSVTHAASPDDGLQALETKSVDCIVSDHDLPDMNGVSLLQCVREDHPDLPFILFTGKGSEEVASEAISAGVTDYLQKETGTSQYEVLANRIVNSVEQQRARAEAQKTEERLRTIAENSNEILWMFSGDWSELLFINSPYEEVWGRSLAELREDTYSLLQGIHPDDRHIARNAMEQLAAGEPIDVEYRVNADEDYARWVWSQGQPVFDETGNVEKVVGFARDITSRKEHEQGLERYKTIVEALGDPVYALDADGKYTFVNDAFIDTTGYSRDEVIGEHVSVVLPEESVQKGIGLIETLLASDRNRGTVEMERILANGERMVVENHLALLPPGEDGSFQGTAGILRDVTNRVEREETLQRERDRIGDFASTVSHDLRNPLDVAQGHVDLAREENDSERLQTIEGALDRMTAIIDDLQTLASGRNTDTKLVTSHYRVSLRTAGRTSKPRRLRSQQNLTS